LIDWSADLVSDKSKELLPIIKSVLWEKNNLSFKLHKAQKKLDQVFKQKKGQLFVGNCSRQWGKSFWAVTKAVERANSIANSQIRYGAAFQSDLIDFIIPAFEKVIDDAPSHKKPKKVGSFFVFPNGARVKMVGLDKNPNGLRGNTLDLIIIDECGFVTNLDYIYKSVIIPATLHRPECDIVFISTPPATPAHPFVDYIQKAESEGAYVKLDIESNPLITQDDIERMAKEMGGRESTTFRRECMCELITDSDLAIIPEFDEKKSVQVVPKDEYYQYYHKYVGMDLGVKDKTAVIFGYYDFKKATLVIEDEFEMHGPNMNTHSLVARIKDMEKKLWKNDQVPRDSNNNPVPFRRISDNNWPILIQDLSSIHNLGFIATTKDSLEAMINEVRLLVQSDRLRINPRCQQLIGSLKYGVWNAKKTEFARSSTYGHFDHLAALIYLVRNMATSSNPIPKDHGFENHKSWLGNIKEDINQSKNVRTLSQALTGRLNSDPMKQAFTSRKGLRR